MMAADADQVASRHYFDREFGMSAVKLLPGEYFVTSEPLVLTTVLGSCVSACVRDTATGIGGMNHFMLPENPDPYSRDAVVAMRFGAYAMTVLLGELFRGGARRERLEAKVFGGGAVLANMKMLNIGERNADFVLRFLEAENVHIAARDLGGKLPRRINYFPGTGRVAVRKLQPRDDLLLVQSEEQELARLLLKQRALDKMNLIDTGAFGCSAPKTSRTI